MTVNAKSKDVNATPLTIGFLISYFPFLLIDWFVLTHQDVMTWAELRLGETLSLFRERRSAATTSVQYVKTHLAIRSVGGFWISREWFVQRP